MRPIDADALVAKLDDWRGDLEDVDKNDAHDVAYYSAMGRALRFAKDAPTLDLAPVVHGEWDDKIVPFCNVCSVCKVFVDRACFPNVRHKGVLLPNIGVLNYCPNCGAKMDGGKKNV